MSGMVIGGPGGPLGEVDLDRATADPTAAPAEAAGVTLASELLAGSPDLARGAQEASIRFGARGEGVRTLQSALGRLGLLQGPADGIFGRDTQRALSQFQRSSGLAADAILGPRTLAALDAALASGGTAAAPGAGGRPPLSGRDAVAGLLASGLQAPAEPDGAAMADAAQALVDKHADHYGVDDPWFNIDSRHALPDNVRLGGLEGSWKCNLFAGNAMVAAGFEPPYYGNRGQGEYPNANQLYKWTDKYAGQFGNAGHERFELRGELDVQSLSGEAREQAIAALLAKAEPGDMIIVDHMGSDVADGGHCRVVVENRFAEDGTVACAQASFDSALVKDERLSSFTGEETIWILRPSKPRPEGAAAP